MEPTSAWVRLSFAKPLLLANAQPNSMPLNAPFFQREKKMNKTFKLFGLLLLLTVQPGLAESGAVNGGEVGDAGSFILTEKQANNLNRKICGRMGMYLQDMEVKKIRFRGCSFDERKTFCASFPDNFEPKDIISIYVSEELEITNHDALDQVLPDAVSQLMTMPCDKTRTAAYQQNYGDNFIKRAIANRRVYEIVNDFFVPLCKKQADYNGCIEKLIYAAEPIPDGSEENIVDFARKLAEWRLKFKGITLTQTDVSRIFGKVISLEEALESARAKEKSEAP